MLRFEWDEAKNRVNRRKHGVWFEEAAFVFDDPFARVFLDPDHSTGEERFLIVGSDPSGRVLVVAHCYRANDTIVRLISARKATPNERRTLYEEGI